MRITPSIDIVEVVWTFAAWVGMIFANLVVGGALDEYRVFLQSGRNGALKALARRHVNIPLVFLLILLVCFVVGIAFMFDAPQDVSAPISPIKIIAGAGFVLVEALAVVGAVYMYLSRVRIMTYKTKSGKTVTELIAEAEDAGEHGDPLPLTIPEEQKNVA